MISEQLKKIKREQKAILGKSNVHISFTQLHDIETETLLELIPITTNYTSRQSLHFDRFRLSIEQEAKFNIKFSQFIKDLVKHVKTPEIEYLYDFLIRKYYVHKFNPKEFLFVILLHREYYTQLRKIDKYAELQWFDCQEEYSTHYIAELCIRDKSFFSLYVNYYEYYQFEFIRCFVDEITDLILQKLGSDVLKCISYLYEIISLLIESENRDKAVEIYVQIKPFLGENTSEFEELIGPIETVPVIKSVGLGGPEIIENTDLDDEFKITQNNSDGRKYLKNTITLKKYLTYLHNNNLKDNGFSEPELALLMGNSLSFVKDYKIEEYKALLNELQDQSLIINRLLEYPTDQLSLMLNDFKHEHWYLVVKRHPIFFKYFINTNNYREVEKLLKKENDLQIFNEFVDYCLEHDLLDTKYFETEFTKDNLIEKMQKSTTQKKIMFNLLQIASSRKFRISQWLIENELYRHSFVLDHIAKDINTTFSTSGHFDNFLFTLPDEIYFKLCSLIEDSNISSILTICNAKKSQDLTNRVLSFVIDKKAYSDQFLSFLCENLEDITLENLQRFLVSYGYKLDIYPIIEYTVFKSNFLKYNGQDKIGKKGLDDVDSELLLSIYKEERYDVLYKLSSVHGFKTILTSFTDDQKEKILEMFYKVKMVEKEEMVKFLLYISDVMRQKDKKFLRIFVTEYENLIYLYQSKKWDVIKIILIEGMSQDVSQELFEIFINNIEIYKNDLDLLNAICSFKIDLEPENDNTLQNIIFESLKRCPNVNVADIIINKTGYCDIRIVPLLTPELIKHRKYSVCKLFETHKNIMACYVKQVLKGYPEIYESLYYIDFNLLIKKLIEYCNCNQEMPSVADKMILHILKEEILPDSTYQLLTDMFVNFIKEPTSSCLYVLSTKYKQEGVLKLIDMIFSSRYDDFIEIAPIGVKNMPLKYTKYVSSILASERLSSVEFKFISAYLKHIPKDQDISEIIGQFDSFLATYLQNNDIDLAKTIARSLNFSRDKAKYTKKILNNLKEPHTVSTLKLLQSVIRNTDNFKKQISLITPHLSLLVDSTKSNISTECQNLITVIDKVYGFNPLIG